MSGITSTEPNGEPTVSTGEGSEKGRDAQEGDGNEATSMLVKGKKWEKTKAPEKNKR